MEVTEQFVLRGGRSSFASFILQYLFLALLISLTICVVSFGADLPSTPERQESKLLPEPSPPDCNSYIIQNALVFNARQRACYYVSKIVSPSGVFGSAFFAGIAQWRDDPHEWGQGARGFGRRFGTRYVQGIAKSTGEFVVGEVFREEPRLFPSKKTGFGNRALHAFINPVVVERPRKKIAISRVVGALSSGFIGQLWYPRRLSTVGQGFARSGSAFGGYIAASFFQEFQPDLLSLVGRIFGSRPDPNTKTKVQTEK
jgi:hypothetical protein